MVLQLEEFYQFIYEWTLEGRFRQVSRVGVVRITQKQQK